MCAQNVCPISRYIARHTRADVWLDTQVRGKVWRSKVLRLKIRVKGQPEANARSSSRHL